MFTLPVRLARLFASRITAARRLPMRTSSRRLGRLRNAIDALPVRMGVLREAYEWFVKFGELPEDDDHVAYEVVQQALRGGEEASLDDEATVSNRVRRAKIAYHERDRPGSTWPPSVRALLFDEALFEAEPIRRLARSLIAAEVAWGGDVENMGFAARYGIPCYGTVAMHVYGWESRLTVAPYEDQAKRLFVRIDNLRGRMPSDEQKWFGEVAYAIEKFRADGELPVDDVLAEGVLTQVEMELLHKHRRGMDVKDVLRVLDRIATRGGKGLAEALAKLKEFAIAGRL